ncbi:hypothetical protein Dsin_022464 [Dipteronia sinensis]|uniref:Reverse transcriptase zinc-binding domain-containing protein n=1 Tax=Dipteronia sinensis TaxID=43782 RepID=A0AAE0A2J4_9ROSI|nr:hypothetical protein Dsin_022464 [Dipteronia sinensis]
MHHLKSDALAWSLNPNGLFSVASFRRGLEELTYVSWSIKRVIWNGICPPKIEVFLWQLYRGKLMVRELGEGLGMAGIGGVLRDSKGKVVCLFSLGVGITDSNSAEILAIKKAVELCQ